jgi:ribosomal protein S18 acetylase RimI-like enzyme
MTEPAQATADVPPTSDTVLSREMDCPPSLWRYLYTEVGREYHWVDRLDWTDDDIARYLADPSVELWVLREGGEVAGYFELRKEPGGDVEIAYFGLLPAVTGRGLGRYLLTSAVERAWARGASRVWVHTSSLDHSSALPNYLARGFRVWKQEVYEV